MEPNETPTEPAVERPSSVRILGQTWKVLYVEDEPLRLGSDSAFGRTFLGKQTILVDVEQAESQKRDTLLHEIHHAILLMLGRHHDPGDGESVVATISPVMLDVLRSNPSLVAFLLADDA